ncbi:MAG: signal peptidase I [Spirochaetia bacterium]|nr:signal peptidase I [Spirochaetia bacterium]
MEYKKPYAPVTHYTTGEKWKNDLRRYGSVFLVIFIWFFSFQYIVRQYLFYPIAVKDNYMQPALEKGKTLFLLYPHLSELRRGDIIQAKIKNTNVELLCRIAAMPGENIEIKNQNIFINNQKLKDDYGFYEDKRIYPIELSLKDNMKKTTVRVKEYFCLHDNREQYTDSRHWGAVSEENIKGKVWAVGMLGI